MEVGNGPHTEDMCLLCAGLLTPYEITYNKPFLYNIEQNHAIYFDKKIVYVV